MRISHSEIKEAISAALAEMGHSGAQPHLMPTEAPRPWGVSSNVCFMLGRDAAAAEVAAATAGLPKNEAKALAAEIGRRVVAELATKLADRLDPAAIPFVGALEAEAGYINFYYDQPALAARVVADALSAGDGYGGGSVAR